MADGRPGCCDEKKRIDKNIAIHWVKTYRTRIFGRYKFIDTVNL